MRFEFLVAKNDIKGLPGLERGEAVVRVSIEVMDGGYEYDVWHRLSDGLVSKTRIEHREEFDVREVEGETPQEVREKVAEVVSRY